MRTKPDDFKFFIEKLRKVPPEEIKRQSEKAINTAAIEYKEFIDTFKQGKCYLCNENLTRSNLKKPCLHWLLRKHKKIKKKHIEQLLKISEVFRVLSYLRWVAKTEGSLSQINDFEAYSERKDLVYQENIRYKNIEWTIWIKKDDLKGHGRAHSKYPHYHIQITIDDLPFVDFTDFHIPLSEWEIFNIHARRGKFSSYKYAFPFGETYSDLFSLVPEDKILSGMVSTKDESKAQFHLRSFIEAEPGKTIKGEDIQQLLEERERTGVPLAKLVQKLKGVKVKTVVTPENLIEPTTRKKRKR
jgi:hypothetical protein